MSQSNPRIIVALDYQNKADASKFIDGINPDQCALKVGKELFTAEGPQFVEQIVARGFKVFLDLKFHDIPNTVHKAIAAACNLGVWMVNVHAMGGEEMLLAAKQAVNSHTSQHTYLIAVSVLTSMDKHALQQIGINKPVTQMVSELTALSLKCGLDGMVCSAREVSELRTQFGAAPLLVTPGIRPEGSAVNDQQRIMTPQQAIQAGSSYLVIGRPITKHDNPQLALEQINESLLGL